MRVDVHAVREYQLVEKAVSGIIVGMGLDPSAHLAARSA